MEILRKSVAVRTEEEAAALLAAMDDFINNPEPGKAQPVLSQRLMEIWNGGDTFEWEWSDETQEEYDIRTAEEDAAAVELSELQNNLEYFKDTKIRPWRNQKLIEWVDETFIKPLKYALTEAQETERINIRSELLDWPDTFTEYKTDEEIDALRPSAPGWITE